MPSPRQHGSDPRAESSGSRTRTTLDRGQAHGHRPPAPRNPVVRPPASRLSNPRQLLNGPSGGARIFTRGVRTTDTGWVMTFVRPWLVLIGIALLGLPGLVGCGYALSQWTGNLFALLGVAAYVGALAVATAWYATMVHTVQLDGPQLIVRRLTGSSSLTIAALTLVTVDGANRLRRSTSGEWYEARGTQVAIYVNDGSVLVCEEPRLAKDLARRILLLRPRIDGRRSERPAPALATLRQIDVGPRSRMRRWGSGIAGPIATVVVALILCTWCVGALGATHGRPEPARAAQPVFDTLRWPATLPYQTAGRVTQVSMQDCEGTAPRLWSADRRNGELAVDALVGPLSAPQVEAIRDRAARLGLRPESSPDPATTVYAVEQQGVRWVAAWHTENGVREARFGVWTGCLDSRDLPADVADHVRLLSDFVLTGRPNLG